jgi:hypothetical protein
MSRWFFCLIRKDVGTECYDPIVDLNGQNAPNDTARKAQDTRNSMYEQGGAIPAAQAFSEIPHAVNCECQENPRYETKVWKPRYNRQEQNPQRLGLQRAIEQDQEYGRGQIQHKRCRRTRRSEMRGRIGWHRRITEYLRRFLCHVVSTLRLICPSGPIPALRVY